MSRNKKYVKHFTVSEILNDDEYIVPIYQRNYAWGKEEIEQLIQDIQSAPKELNYYIGSLIVYQRNDGKFEVIDGQQRLTTLNIIAIACGLERSGNLSFEYRNDTKESFDKLAKEHSKGDKGLSTASSIEMGYRDAINAIPKENLDMFKKFLGEKVVILRTEVPPRTDLNHYFEIMNNRGEQLEKHEILKSLMMSKLDKNGNEQNLFAMIWDACSDMNRYVVASFKKSIRDQVFSLKDERIFLNKNSFDEIYEKIKLGTESDTQNRDVSSVPNQQDTKAKSILDVISDKKFEINGVINEERYERFSSIINFPNFLMYVLKIYFEKAELDEKQSEVSLDDKDLLKSFEYFSKGKENTEIERKNNIKEFAFLLLKSRILFDNYVIKSEINNNSHWSLKAPYYTSGKLDYKNTFGDTDEQKQKTIVMLLSMFHTAYPSRNYKNWLYAVLRGLVLNDEWYKTPEDYIAKLERLCDQFYFNNYWDEQEFLDIIYKDTEPKDIKISYSKFKNILNSGTSVNHFIFNRLDYMLWREDKSKYKDFRFSFRNSVEHYYPRNPNGSGNRKILKVVDRFGNLCLVSRERNASLGNRLPDEKKEVYKNLGKYDSLKQQEMMLGYDKWTENEIKKHGNEMIKLLNKKLTDS